MEFSVDGERGTCGKRRSGEAEADARRLYAESLYFSDTLLTSESHEHVVKHMARMHSGTGTLAVEPLGRVVSGADFYLIWRMRASFQPLIQEVNSDTLGISHLRFDADGRVVLHQDFWDAAAGFYQHIPLLGGAIRAVGNWAAVPLKAVTTMGEMKVQVEIIDVFTFNEDGLIADMRAYWTADDITPV